MLCDEAVPRVVESRLSCALLLLPTGRRPSPSVTPVPLESLTFRSLIFSSIVIPAERYREVMVLFEEVVPPELEEVTVPYCCGGGCSGAGGDA